MKLFIFILLTFSALNPALVYSSCEEAFSRLTSGQKKAPNSVWAVHSLYGSGTGFSIGPSTLVTNAHVLIEALKSNRIDDITLIQEGNPLKGNPRILKVKGIKHFSVIHDLAVLETEEVNDYLNLKQGVPSSQENLSAISYSNGNFKVIEKTGDIFYKSEFDYTFLGNSSNNSGASGSPVLNTDGEVVGVHHAGNGNALYAVKIIHLQNLIEQKVEVFRSPKDHLEHSIKEAIEAAEQGSVIAQNNLAAFYWQGLGVKQDFEKAIYWLRKAAEQGDADAQFALGYLYDEGLGVPKDYKEASQWYKKSAEQGHADAQFALGYFYDEGIGVEQDYQKALKWYKKAAEQGHAFAQYSLALSYRLGRGVKQDFKKAFDLCKKAAKQGHALAQENLPIFYKMLNIE